MTRHFSPPTVEDTAISAVLVTSARCWREARDRGESVQPCLSRILDDYDCAMLAPVLDSLCIFYEAALGRPLTVGDALALSDDEHRLLDLVEGAGPFQRLKCVHGTAHPLDCAIYSTRIMLMLTLTPRPTETMQ